ncbi:MAG TPA: DUF5990 family protein [Acidimicrobiales bacterium]|nr:DUF5990 family protein [Acidimicrobiales bacterium]
MGVRIRIVGTDLPGRRCGPAPTPRGVYENIHVGVQRGSEVVALVPGDAPLAHFEFEITVREGRFGGPFVHGRDERFVYLSWGELAGGSFRMFRRAKLQLDHLDPAEVDGRTVQAMLGLSDEKGHPLCASVRPPRVVWTVE